MFQHLNYVRFAQIAEERFSSADLFDYRLTDLHDHHIATMYDPNESDDIEVYIWIVDETFNSLACADA